MNETEIYIETMRKNFDRDFREVTLRYLHEIREIREKYRFKPLGRKED